MKPKSDFTERYSPLIYLLTSEADLDTIASDPGYTLDIGRKIRDSTCRSLLDYALQLETDFSVLYEASYPIALKDPSLAADLAIAQEDLRKIIKAIRFHVSFIKLVPVPRPRKPKSALRTMLLALKPQIVGATELLREIQSIQGRVAPSAT